jgi:hypothetical protein
MTLGWLQDYVAYIRRSGETNEHKSLRFVGSAWPIVGPDERVVLFSSSYVHLLCSSVTR